MDYKRLVFIEFGIGNPHFISTEIEKPNGFEYRIKGLCRLSAIRGIYLRLWIKKSVYVLSSFDGFKKSTKPKTRFKFLFGISGYR